MQLNILSCYLCINWYCCHGIRVLFLLMIILSIQFQQQHNINHTGPWYVILISQDHSFLHITARTGRGFPILLIMFDESSFSSLCVESDTLQENMVIDIPPFSSLKKELFLKKLPSHFSFWFVWFCTEFVLTWAVNVLLFCSLTVNDKSGSLERLTLLLHSLPSKFRWGKGVILILFIVIIF